MSETTKTTPAANKRKRKEKTEDGPTTTEKPKKPAPLYPPPTEMVLNAVKTLNEKGGSSRIHIKKFIASEYKVDVEKLTGKINKALKDLALTGYLWQANGPNGSFSLPPPAKKSKKNEEEAEKSEEEVKEPKKNPSRKSRGRPKRK